MNKSTKLAISLLATFGSSLLISAPLIILSANKNKNNVEQIKEKNSRYRLTNWIINKQKQNELFSYFFSSQQILKNQIIFNENDVNKVRIKSFFKSLLFDIFKYPIDNTEINLKIDYEMNETNNQCKLILKWYFIDKKHNIILKNTKYYDILMLYF